MTRDPTGKPLPAREPSSDWTEEPTTRTEIPTSEELMAELRQHAESGQGDDDFSYRRAR